MPAVLGLLPRLFITVAAAALPSLLARLRLPGLEDPEATGAAVSVGALGLDMVLCAFVVVELATWIVPAWRGARRDRVGPAATAARVARLRATMVLGVVLVLAHALYVAWSLRAWGTATPGVGALVGDMAALVGGTAALLLAARVVSRRGIGHGLSVVVVLGALPAWLDGVALASSLSHDREMLARTLVLTALAAAVVIGREVRGHCLPTAGLLPLLLPTWLMHAWLMAGVFLALPLDHDLGAALYAPSTAAMLTVTTLLTIALSRRLPTGSSPRARWAALLPAVGGSALVPPAILGGDRALSLDVSWAAMGAGLATFVLAVAVAIDVLRELAIRARTPLVAVLAFDRPEVAARVGRALAAADIAHVMRGHAHRTLLRVFGPWVPMRLLVERERADEAARIARAEANREAYEELARNF